MTVPAPNVLPLLSSEEVLLTAGHYSFEGNVFTGILDVQLYRPLDMPILTEAYRILIANRFSFNISFVREGGKNYKKREPMPFVLPKSLGNRLGLELWKKKSLDITTGPLHEMAFLSRWGRCHLYFKFHHLIMDGLSVLYFFEDLFMVYKELLVRGACEIQPDFSAYRELMSYYTTEENKNCRVKKDFWKAYLRRSNPPPPDPPRSRSVVDSFIFSRRHLRTLLGFKKRYDISIFSIFLAAYASSLREVFGIASLPLRLVTSCRRRIKSTEQKRILASLSRGFPLIVDQNSDNIIEMARESRAIIREAEDHMIVHPIPWSREDFGAFSEKKKRTLCFSISYSAYGGGEGAMGFLRGFDMRETPQDIALFIILSERGIMLNFFYKTDVFLSREIGILKKTLKKKILLL